MSSHNPDFNVDNQVSREVGKKADEKVLYNYEMQMFPSEQRPGLRRTGSRSSLVITLNPRDQQSRLSAKVVLPVALRVGVCGRAGSE